MTIVINCPNCGRPNGTRFPKCMYCGTALPPPEEAPPPGEGEAGGDGAEEALKGAMDPALLASLPQRLRGALEGGVTSSRKQSPPAAAPPAPDLPLRAPANLDPTDVPEPMSVDDEWSEDQEAVNTDKYEAVDSSLTSIPLVRGRGPWGPRGAPARVLLLPDDSYKRRIPWLRARLTNQLGLDAYTCNMYLQREFPVFLKDFKSEEEARRLADNLADGGMRVLLLSRHAVEEFPTAFQAIAADIHGLDVVFRGADGHELTMERTLLQRAVFAEIAPPEQATSGPLVERSFWRTRPARQSRSMEEIDGPYWMLEFIVDPPGPNVRVRADEFDFAFLGGDSLRSSLLSLRKLPEVIAAPGAEIAIDDTFKRLPRLKRELAPDEPMPWNEEELLFAEYTLIESLGRQVPPPEE